MTRWLILAVVAPLVLASCASLGGEGDACETPEDCEVGLECFDAVCTAAELTCGPGTVQQAGQPNTPTFTQFCVPEPRQRCGRGTVEVDGVCVPEPPEGG